MKILVIGDLHGQMPKIYFKDFDTIICVGDVCSDRKIRGPTYKSYREFLANPSKYRDWWDITGKKTAKDYVHESVNRGRKILQKLNSYGVPVYIIPGNWDYAVKDHDWKFLDQNFYRKYIIKGLRNVKDCDSRLLNIGECSIIGYGLVNGPELLQYRNYENIPKDAYGTNLKKYRKLKARFDKLFLKSQRPVILLSHNVPFNTALDKINNKDSPMNGKHYGSNLARDMILKHKPILCISGHMHEHYGTCRLGKTTVLNAGFGSDKNTLIEVVDGKVKSIKFHGKKC